jgi:hypothetical protein
MSGRTRRALRRALLAGVALGALVSATAANAASTLPKLNIAINATSATVPASVESGGTNVVIADTGVKEASVILLLLKPGVTLAEAESFAASKKASGEPNNSVKVGSLVFDAEASPGKTAEAQSNLQPGTYVVLVGQGEKPVVVRGHFTVTPAKAPQPLPKAAATIRSIEFGFTGPTTIHDGELVAFENEGFLVHMNIGLPVKNMGAARALVKDLRAGNEKAGFKLVAGPPVGFAGPMSHEAMMEETITAKPGVYVEACFMDTQDHRQHTQLGMERIIRVTK